MHAHAHRRLRPLVRLCVRPHARVLLEGALGGDRADYDLYAASAAFRRAVCEALPDGVTLAGHHFFGAYAEQDCEWDSPLDIRAIIDSIDLEPIIKAHQTGSRTR